jgi:hypothetical protein
MTAPKKQQNTGNKLYRGDKHEPCGTYLRYTSNGHCKACECKDKGENPSAYYHGVSARNQGHSKKFEQTVDGYWWAAGWNDRDMEIEKKNAERKMAIKNKSVFA